MESLHSQGNTPFNIEFGTSSPPDKAKELPHQEEPASSPPKLESVSEGKQKASQTIDSNDVAKLLTGRSHEPSGLTQKVKAHAEEYGNKAANLIVLESICSSVKSNTFQTHVPPIVPLSHEMILAHIKSQYPSFDSDWEQFVQLQSGAQTLTDEGKNQLDKIRENIRQVFTEHPLPTDLSKLGKGPLMVRSTGREDTKEGAMAGANESIAGVACTAQEVSEAIGSVVASYLSEGSMMQKIIAGMDIQEKPFVPVLLQVMVGEDPHSTPTQENLMVAGVAYTKEMAGETKDLTVVEAAYGHNEGVVNAQVNTDTFYIYPNGQSHQIIAEKPDRLVAMSSQAGDSKFVRVDNPSSKAKLPSLSRELQHHIRLVSKAIHDAYGEPMDIEWVYNPSKKTLYVVQARPIVQRYEATPGVVDRASMANVSKGRMIVHRGGEPVIITNPNQLIQRRNLDSALKVFLNPENRGKIKAIVVEEMGSALSHAACVFRENGIPVLVASPLNLETFSTKGTVAVLDGQQGLIGTIQRDSFAGKDPSHIGQALQEEGTLKPGWYKHPIGADESLQDYGLSEADYRRLGNLLLTGEPLGPHTLSEQFHALSSDNPAQVAHAARTIVTSMALTVKHLSDSPDPSVQPLAERGRHLLSNALVILDSLLGAQDRMQCLHAARRLEALCYQEGSPRLIDTESLRSLFSAKQAVEGFDANATPLTTEDQATLRIMTARAKVGDQAMQQRLATPMTDKEISTAILVFRSIKPLILDAGAKQRWEEITTKLIASRSRVANQLLIDLISQVEKVGVLSDWLNLTVASSPPEMETSLGLITQWREEWREIRPALSEISTLKRSLTQLESAGAAWKNPKAFAALWPKMVDEVVTPLKEQIANLTSQDVKNPLLAASLQRVIVDGIETLDHCIKFSRGDTEENIESKVDRFATMLVSYHELMLQLFDAIPQETFSQWTSGIVAAEKHSTSEGYRKTMRATINDTFELKKTMRNAAQIEPSGGANVMSQCVNSGALFSMTFHPDETTLEDLFTLFHQNMLAALDCFRPSYDPSHFPEPLRDALQSIEGINKTVTYGGIDLTLHPTIVSQTIKYPFVTSVYNMPIKYHSSKVTVTHNVVSNTTTIKFDIYGHNLNSRMDLIALLLATKGWNEAIQMAAMPAYDSETRQLSCQLACDGNSEKIAQLLLDAAENTLEGNFGVVKYIDAKILVKTNPQALTTITQTPGCLRQLALSSSYGKNYVWELINQALLESQNIPTEVICKLLAEMNINVQANNHTELLANLHSLFKQNLISNKNDELVPQGWIQVPIDPIKRLFLSQSINQSPLIHSLLEGITEEDFPMFLCPGAGEIGGSGFYSDVCMQFAKHLQKSGKEEFLLKFLNYLAQHGQFASALAIQASIDRPNLTVVKVPTGFPEPKPEPASDDEGYGTDYGEMPEGLETMIEDSIEKPKEKEFHQRFDDALGAYKIPGRRATESEMSSDPVEDVHMLQPGNWLLLPQKARGSGYIKDHYTLVKIESISLDPLNIVVARGEGKTKTLTSLEYVKVLH